MKTHAKIELDGDFFRRDPDKTLRTNIKDMLAALSGELEEEVVSDIQARAGDMPNWTGWTADHIRGYVVSTKTGRRWGTWAAVGIPTTGMDAASAIRTKAAASSIERRFHPFRRVKSAVYRSRAVISADLTKGMG